MIHLFLNSDFKIMNARQKAKVNPFVLLAIVSKINNYTCTMRKLNQHFLKWNKPCLWNIAD